MRQCAKGENTLFSRGLYERKNHTKKIEKVLNNEADAGTVWTSIIEQMVKEGVIDAEFSHSICPDCAEQLFNDYAENLESPEVQKDNNNV